MTIALVIKVNDGIVLAADSATTMTDRQNDGSIGIVNIYNNANKVFNLHKALPIGAMTWGLGNIGPASIATIAKDVRRRFHGEGHEEGWKIDESAYDIATVASHVHDFIHEEKFQPMADSYPKGTEIPRLGFLTAGYSADSDDPQVFVMQLGDASHEPQEVLAGATGASWWGVPEAISRILNGVSLDTPAALVNMKVGLSEEQAVQFSQAIQDQVRATLVQSAMPIQDAIDLAEFLVYATIQYVRFAPGNPTVGGPIEIATITKHEGFKWVARKHYYESRFNPPLETR